MTPLTIRPYPVTPEFDIMQYLEICGDRRIEHDRLERLEAAWNDWKDRLKSFKLVQGEAPEGKDGLKKAEGFLLIHLTEGVEDAVEDAWAVSEEEGAAFHNLAVTLVMAAAQSVIPEMLQGACAPLTRPGEAVQAAFKELDLEWQPLTGSLNRSYALFTPHPYRGGCEVCFQKNSCPQSTLKQ